MYVNVDVTQSLFGEYGKKTTYSIIKLGASNEQDEVPPPARGTLLTLYFFHTRPCYLINVGGRLRSAVGARVGDSDRDFWPVLFKPDGTSQKKFPHALCAGLQSVLWPQYVFAPLLLTIKTKLWSDLDPQVIQSLSKVD